ncbi:hypothetical protein N5P37_009677 [Trichoderma harzianum]|uniref:Uncharacterized protein n=1 Tax=Trichoderma harzianum CBS 226.95 TaxID=983964 RepID=A0A2T4AE96_TRIHA|nr:hypothetical protein M431DRAFT_4404 [Trichoderma harzianum CBS 226.95]KAK0757663.1 hypothetical protein N5P37_009677 [Trichoderma harzianum]PKK43977.1 hypothetical protein CI102_13767 [Trichoderma harzianum]PTB55389.1 hypothetical protein M431DRAFT_4404 [Trichoderma harzianum CBS 226.95]
MDRTIKALKRPITTVRQVWKDYQVGRAIRHSIFESDPKEEECEERCDEECQVACREENNETCKEEHDENRNEERNEVGEEECSDPNEDQCKDNEVSSSSQPATCRTAEGEEEERAAQVAAQLKLKRKWRANTNGEFLWRYEQVVDEESNWRGTWVLEVNDLNAMKWGIEEVPTMIGNRKGKKYVRKPTRQLPFPVGQERELLPSEGGQDDSKIRYC